MPKRDFNKVAKPLYWNHTSIWVFSFKFGFFGYLFQRTPLDGCFCFLEDKKVQSFTNRCLLTMLSWPSASSNPSCFYLFFLPMKYSMVYTCAWIFRSHGLPTFLQSKREVTQRKQINGLKTKTIKRLSPRTKRYCFSHSRASRIQISFLSANHGCL